MSSVKSRSVLSHAGKYRYYEQHRQHQWVEVPVCRPYDLYLNDRSSVNDALAVPFKDHKAVFVCSDNMAVQATTPGGEYAVNTSLIRIPFPSKVYENIGLAELYIEGSGIVHIKTTAGRLAKLKREWETR